jgi:ribosomal protein L17
MSAIGNSGEIVDHGVHRYLIEKFFSPLAIAAMRRSIMNADDGGGTNRKIKTTSHVIATHATTIKKNHLNTRRPRLARFRAGRFELGISPRNEAIDRMYYTVAARLIQTWAGCGRA